jgi:hypothetical protein
MYLHSAVSRRAGDVDIAFRQWINSHSLLPVDQVACHLQRLSQWNVRIQRHYLQAKEDVDAAMTGRSLGLITKLLQSGGKAKPPT